MAQSAGNAFFAFFVEHRFCPCHGQWGKRGHLPRHCQGCVRQAALVGVDVIDQANPFGPLRSDVLGRQRQLAQVALADDSAQSLQTAHVGNDRQPRFPDAELRIGAGQAYIGGTDQIHAAANAPA